VLNELKGHRRAGPDHKLSERQRLCCLGGSRQHGFCEPQSCAFNLSRVAKGISRRSPPASNGWPSSLRYQVQTKRGQSIDVRVEGLRTHPPTRARQQALDRKRAPPATDPLQQGLSLRDWQGGQRAFDVSATEDVRFNARKRMVTGDVVENEDVVNRYAAGKDRADKAPTHRRITSQSPATDRRPSLLCNGMRGPFPVAINSCRKIP
jgi:hypothetical protein